MSYLIRNKSSKTRAHIWDGLDTKCRMWSTGGLISKKGYYISESREGREVCFMCQAKAGLIKPSMPEDNWENEPGFTPF